MKKLLKNRLLFLDLLVFAVWLAINIVIIGRHEPWSDEAQPWLLVRDTSLPQFFDFMLNNYDGHPMLWYLMIMPLVKAGLPYFSQAILHLIVSFSALVIFVRKAPFSRPLKYAWAFSYLVMFEYAVIVRMYALVLLVLFLVASAYASRFRRPLRYAFLLFLLWNTENLMLGLGAGLAAAFGLECLMRLRLREARFPWLAMILMACGAVLVYIQLFRVPPDHLFYGRYIHGPLPGFQPFLTFSRGFVPVRMDVSDFAAMALTWSAMTLALLGLLRKPLLLAILAPAHGLLFYIFTFIHYGDVRHHGFFLVILLFMMWIEHDHPANARWTGALDRFYDAIHLGNPLPKARVIITVCLLLSIRATVMADMNDYNRPFSGSREMAGKINTLFEEYHLDEEGFSIVAFPHTQVCSILPYMKRKFWYPHIGKFGSYNAARVYPVDEQSLDAAEVIRMAGDYFHGLDKLFFIFRQPLPFQELYGYRFNPVAVAGQDVWGTNYESYFLYKPVPAVAGQN